MRLHHSERDAASTACRAAHGSRRGERRGPEMRGGVR
jgi:hypothetical protein